MLEGMRRRLSHRREAREKGALKGIEKERRLSYIKMKRLQERKSAEVELKEQVGAEVSAHEAAKRALRERRQMEKELRTSRGRGIGARVLRGAGRVTKGVLYDLPVKTARLGTRLSRGPRLRKILVGDTAFVLGTRRPSTQPIDEFLFGKPSAPSAKGKSPGVLDIDRDILS